MNLTRSALVAAVATAVVWALKAVAIATAGGLGRSPLEGPLFLLGLVGAVVAAALTGMAAVARHRRRVRLVGAGLGLVAFSVFGTAEGAVVSAVQPAHPGWVWGEVNLWVLVLALLAVSAVLVARSRSGSGRTQAGRTAAALSPSRS